MPALEPSRTIRRNSPQLLMAQAGLRELPSVYIIDKEGSLVITALEDTELPFISAVAEAIDGARRGRPGAVAVARRIPIASSRSRSSRDIPDHYLYVAREVSAHGAGGIARTEQGVDEYEPLRAPRGKLKLVHGLMYLMISLTGTAGGDLDRHLVRGPLRGADPPPDHRRPSRSRAATSR